MHTQCSGWPRTPPFNKVLATNCVGKQQVQIKTLKTMAPYTTGAKSIPAANDI